MNNDFGTSADHLEPCEHEVLEPNVQTPTKATNPLDRFSLRGMSAKISKEVMDAVFVLLGIALLGQLTVLYALPNTGKTLFTLYLLIQGIKDGLIDPDKVFYLNMDDTIQGLCEKLIITEEYGFHMVAEGYNDFSAGKFLDIIKRMTEDGSAKGVIIVLDTLKKFTDLMDKRACTEFGKIVRAFVMKGGTLIALAHTNKNLGTDGKPIHAGTSDIREDFDCAFLLQIIEGETNKTVVEFTNIKKRGNVEKSTAYSYSSAQGLTYEDLLMSVEKVDAEELEPMKQKAEMLTDEEVTDVIEACIREGINTKMDLASAAAERTNISKRHAIQIIEKYDKKLWYFVVREHGAKVFELMYG
jgi:hypothetical protein